MDEDEKLPRRFLVPVTFALWEDDLLHLDDIRDILKEAGISVEIDPQHSYDVKFGSAKVHLDLLQEMT